MTLEEFLRACRRTFWANRTTAVEPDEPPVPTNILLSVWTTMNVVASSANDTIALLRELANSDLPLPPAGSLDIDTGEGWLGFLNEIIRRSVVAHLEQESEMVTEEQRRIHA